MLFHQSTAWAIKKCVIVTHFTKKIICTYLYITCNKKILFVTKYLSLFWVFTDLSILLVAFWTQTLITQQLIWTARTLEAECWQVCGKRGYGDKGRWVKQWVRLGCWISACYGPFLLGARFETYELFISLIFRAAVNCGKLKPRICGSACTRGEKVFKVTVSETLLRLSCHTHLPTWQNILPSIKRILILFFFYNMLMK